MATVMLAWELGGGLGHLYPLAQVARHLEREREVIKLKDRVKQLEAVTPTIVFRPVPPPGTRKVPSGIQFDFKHSPKDKFDPFPPEIENAD